MPRIRTVPLDEAGPELVEAYARIDDLPITPLVFQLASIRPDFAGLLTGWYEALFRRGELSRSAKDVIGTYVSSLNQCSFCTTAQGAFMAFHGAGQEQIDAAQACDLPTLTDDEEVGIFLPLADKISRHSHEVTDDDIEALRSAGWSDEKILEAVSVVAFFNFLNRFADTLGIVRTDAEGDIQRAFEALAQQT